MNLRDSCFAKQWRAERPAIYICIINRLGFEVIIKLIVV